MGAACTHPKSNSRRCLRPRARCFYSSLRQVPNPGCPTFLTQAPFWNTSLLPGCPFSKDFSNMETWTFHVPGSPALPWDGQGGSTQ